MVSQQNEKKKKISQETPDFPAPNGQQLPSPRRNQQQHAVPDTLRIFRDCLLASKCPWDMVYFFAHYSTSPLGGRGRQKAAETCGGNVPRGVTEISTRSRTTMNTPQQGSLTDAQSSMRYANSYYRSNCNIINPDSKTWCSFSFRP